MQKRNYSSGQTRAIAAGHTSDVRWRYLIVLLVCGSILAAGFFFAAGQHFSAMSYSMQNSELKKRVENLEAEKRRLMLAREVALSPREIRKAATMLASARRTAKTNIAATAQQASLKQVTTHVGAQAPAKAVTAEIKTPAKSEPAADTKKQRSDEVAGERRERFEMTAVAAKLR